MKRISKKALTSTLVFIIFEFVCLIPWILLSFFTSKFILFVCIVVSIFWYLLIYGAYKYNHYEENHDEN